jgi:predicted N-acetyltransferase YhbS
MHLRPETAADYPAIADVNARAFNGRAAEPAIVALLRQGTRFDPALSLVVEVDGRVVGHVLFTPHTVRLLGQSVAAVNLAPLAIHPDYQGRGLGGRLIEAGHAAARERGYAFSFLLGHHTYYPRFGYRTHAYGAAALTLAPADLGSMTEAPALTSRVPRADDVPALHALWQIGEANVDFALDPGLALLDWLSPNPAIEARVFLEGERPVAYARIVRDMPHLVRLLLAESGQVTRRVAAHLASADAPEIVLPVHPASTAALGLPAASVTAWQAGMACPLRPSPLDDYLAQLSAGRRVPGSVVWPVAFEVA